MTEQLPIVENSDGLRQDFEPVSLMTHAEPEDAGSPHPVVVLDRAFGSGLLNPQHPDRYDLRLAAKARTVEHRADLRLVWSLSLPRTPRLTFRPAVPSLPGCTATYRLAVRFHGDTEVIFEKKVSGPPLWESAEESIDLARWQGLPVELVASGGIEPLAGGGEALFSEPDCGEEVLGWASPVVWSAERVVSAPRRNPNVILLGLDTVRADHLGAWGRRPSPTPALDQIATESDVFLQAYSAFNVTNPSFISLHTGLYGKNHGVYELDVPVAPEAVTLAELFKQHGYATQAVLGATHLADRASGLGQGFDGVHVPWGQFTAEEVVRRGLAWLETVDEFEMPFFLWLHFFDAHTPHLPPMPYALGLAPAKPPGLLPVADWRSLRPRGLLEHVDKGLGAHPDSYDDGLAYLDRQLGRLLETLDRRGLLETTWIVIVADHGENLTEHGLVCRHAGLWDTTLHVPLVIRPPGPRGQAGRRFEALVQTLDVFPTILQAVNIQTPPTDGEDLYRVIDAGGRPAVFAEHAHRTGASVRTSRYLYYRQGPDDVASVGVYFYDLETDPGQENSLAGQGLEIESDMAALLDSWLQHANPNHALPTPESEPLSDEESSQLRALGYVER